MKYLLIMVMCSSAFQVCSPPVQLEYYNTWFDCSSSGYLKSHEFNQKLGQQRVEQEKIIINFECKMVGTI